MTKSDSVESVGISHSYWQTHKTEIIWALIFAAAVGIIFELVRNILKFRTNLKKRNSSLRIYIKEFWELKIAGDRPKPLNKREIERSIESKLDNLDKASIVFAIDKKVVLKNKDKTHYETTGYHFDRFFKIGPILNGEELFFVEACRTIGEMLISYEIDCVLHLEKFSDSIFCTEVANQSLPNRIKIYPLGYNEQANFQNVIYRENESLEGQNVAILTALALTEKPLVDLAEFVRDQGANLVIVAILFDAIWSIIDLNAILGVQVISAINIDLKHCKFDQCTLCGTKSKIKRIGFNDY